jgi:hypothetical protein
MRYAESRGALWSLALSLSLLHPQVELPNLEEEERSSDGEEKGMDSEETQFHVELDAADGRAVRGCGMRGEVARMEGGCGDESSVLGLHYSLKPEMQNDQAEKLDVMMRVCQEHIYRMCHPNSES